MNVGVYDLQAVRRDTVVELLRGQGLKPEGCYSQERLRRWIQTTATCGDRLLVCHEDYVKEVVGDHPCLVKPLTYSEASPDVAHRAKREAHRSQGRSATLSVDKDLIVIGSSTGGLPIVSQMIRRLRFTQSRIIVCQHVGDSGVEMVRETLEGALGRTVYIGEPGGRLRNGTVTVIPSHGAGLDRAQKLLIAVPDECSPRPRIDALLKTLVDRPVGKVGVVIVSGLGEDGSMHLKTLVESGAEVAFQSPQSCTAPYMPRAAKAAAGRARGYEPTELTALMKRWAI